MIGFILSTCSNALLFFNGNNKPHESEIWLAVPKEDLSQIKGIPSYVHLYGGSRDDVLSRYSEVLAQSHADYIVRITGDCPLIPTQVILQCMELAIKGEFDYFSNVDESCRTMPDGWDCEVISKRLLLTLDDQAKDPDDREHVTTWLRKEGNRPEWANYGMLMNWMDLSHIKVSVDTADDLARVKKEAQIYRKKFMRALEVCGNGTVFSI